MNKEKAEAAGQGTSQVAQAIVQASGNALLCQVANYFRSKAWTTRLSQYYVDATTDKAREIDLIVERVFEFGDAYERSWVHLHVRLCVECKYAIRPVVFWFDQIDSTSVGEWVERTRPFSRANSYSKELHYYKYGTDVAKLFASASHGEESEPLFKALNQVLHGFVNTRGRSITAPPRREASKSFTLAYPLIVFANFDSFYRTHVNGNPEPERLTDNFLFEINYAYPNIRGISVPEYFLVDMVSLATLDKFLDQISSEVEAAKIIA